MKFDSYSCCQSAGGQPSVAQAFGGSTVVPWLLPEKPITLSTIARVSGQKRSGQRIDIPPWLWPMTAILRWASAYSLRIAYTRYSPEVSMLSSVECGAVYAHHGMPSLSSAGSQFQE